VRADSPLSPTLSPGSRLMIPHIWTGDLES
jgi:hypothetical protein